MKKDSVLKKLSKEWDVANFVSVSPMGEVRASNLSLLTEDLETDLKRILEESPRHLVNVRSFCTDAENIKTEFVLGLGDIGDILRQVEKNCENGLYSIVNENIDPCDGGVSGVLHGDIIEFVTNGTPRDVEKGEKVISLGKAIGIKMLEQYYDVDLERLRSLPMNSRIEFAITRDKRLLVWEVKQLPNQGLARKKMDLNVDSLFVETIREKVFGLLLVNALRLNVVESTVVNSIGNTVSFGKKVQGESELDTVIYRASPSRFSPGEFDNSESSINVDIVERIKELEERDGITYLAQKKLNTKLVGGVISSKGRRLVEFSDGNGQDFMLGKAIPIEYQGDDLGLIVSQVDYICSRIESLVGNSFKLELIVDEFETVYVAQFNVINDVQQQIVISKEERENALEVDVKEETPLSLANRLEYLEVRGKQVDLVVFKGNIGHTSHFCDVVNGRGIRYIIEK